MTSTNLVPFPSVWRSRSTKTIRVPVSISDRILNIAHLLDRHPTCHSDIIDALELARMAKEAALKRELKKKEPNYSHINIWTRQIALINELREALD